MFIDHVETYTQIFLRPLHNTLGLVLELLRHNPHSQLLRVVAIFWLVIHFSICKCLWLVDHHYYVFVNVFRRPLLLDHRHPRRHRRRKQAPTGLQCYAQTLFG